MRRSVQSGISLIEILVTVAIVSLLIAIGMPAFSIWIQNTQIRTATEAVMNGLQTAKNQAIQQNVSMQLKLVNGTANTQWAVNLQSDPNRVPPLYARAAEEGSPNATVTITPAGADTVTFNSLGRIDTNQDGSPPITQIVVNNTLIPSAADRRPLAILIPTGGAIRMCDPKVAAGDPRTCLPTVVVVP